MTDEVTNEVVETVETVDEVVETPTEETTQAAKTVSQEDFNALYFKLKQSERELEATKKAEAPTTEVTPAKEINIEDFDYDDDAYNNAVMQHQIETQVAAALKAQNTVTEQTTAKQKQDEVASTFNNRAVAYASTNPEYEKAIAAANGVQFANHIQEVILTSDVGPQLDHMLLSDPTLITKLHELTPTAAIMELGRMEAKFSAPATAKAQVSTAPAPFETGGGGVSTGGDFRYDDNMDMDTYYRKSMEGK